MELGRDTPHIVGTRTTSLSDVAMNYLCAIRCRSAFRCDRKKSQAIHQHQSEARFGDPRIPYRPLWVGLATKTRDAGIVEVAITCHDGTYTTDFAVHVLHTDAETDRKLESAKPTNNIEDRLAAIDELCIRELRNYACGNYYKFLGAGIYSETVRMRPQLPARLWAELDIVPITLTKEGGFDDADEIADSMARKCIM